MSAAVLMLTGLLAVASTPAHASATVIQISAGLDHVCALSSDQDIYCWGHNDAGQLGDGTNDSSNVPVLVSGGHDWVYVDAGSSSTCAITTDGDAYCWGWNNSGQVGNNDNDDVDTPQLVHGGLEWESISAGWRVACGVTTTGAGYCWGEGYFGGLGSGDGSQYWEPNPVSGAYTWRTIDTGGKHTCGVTTTDVGYCWGTNDAGELGAPGGGTDVPQLVSGSHAWNAITVSLGTYSEQYSCGVTTTGAGYCWGGGSLGQLGNSSTDDVDTPDPISGGGSWSVISANGVVTTCGVDDSGSAYCWGNNDWGSLGDGTNDESDVPVAVAGGYQFASITVGDSFGCGLTSVGTVYCWGWNDFGTLGNGDNQETNSPVLVAALAADGSDTTLDIVVVPSMTFTVGGRATVCNGQSSSGFQTASTGTAVSLGNVNQASLGGGAQDLSVVTNAGNGFVVYLRTPGSTPDPLRSGVNSIDDVVGTHASPGAAPVAGTEGFGYTTSDLFGSNLWAALTNTNESVLVATAGTTNKATCLGYEVAVAGTTPAGVYSATVIYTAVPTY